MGEQENVSAENAQYAIELMGEFEGFSRVTTMAGQGWQRDRVRAQSDGVISGYGPPVLQAEATGEIEASGQAAVGATANGWYVPKCHASPSGSRAPYSREP